MKSPINCGHGWTHCVVLLMLVFAFIVCETSGHPAAIIGSAQHHSHGHGHGHGSSMQTRQPRRATRPITRPAECRDDTIFLDCYLCGKISDDVTIYRQCCHRETKIVEFCTELLT